MPRIKRLRFTAQTRRFRKTNFCVALHLEVAAVYRITVQIKRAVPDDQPLPMGWHPVHKKFFKA